MGINVNTCKAIHTASAQYMKAIFYYQDRSTQLSSDIPTKIGILSSALLAEFYKSSGSSYSETANNTLKLLIPLGITFLY